MIDELLMIVLDPIYKPLNTNKDFERKYELIYAEGRISNMDYVKQGQLIVNQRSPNEMKNSKGLNQDLIEFQDNEGHYFDDG